MKTVFCLVLLTPIIVKISLGHLTIGSCDKSWYLIEKAFCDTEFVKYMNDSSNAFEKCSDLYDEAHKCFEQKIYDECFEGEDLSKDHNETVKFLEAEFGDENFFCKYGLLPSMESVMTNVNFSICADQEFTDYKQCETPFRDAFKAEFESFTVDFERLAKTFAEAKICQSKVAYSCKIPNNETTYHFFDVTEFNPYDSVAMERLKKAADEIESGGSVKSGGATTVTIVIVGLVVVAIVVGVFFYLRRRDRNRAEIRRQKRERASIVQKQQQSEETEMQPLSKPAVVQASDEVSTA